MAEFKFAAILTKYTGFYLSHRRVHLQGKKIEDYEHCQVCSFLGAFNHYKQYISNSLHVASELTASTKQGAKFKWSYNCQSDF